LDLTAGIDVDDVVIAEIDRDRTGTISADEAQAYASLVPPEHRWRVPRGAQPGGIRLDDARICRGSR
jgi:hypothetical protein